MSKEKYFLVVGTHLIFDTSQSLIYDYTGCVVIVCIYIYVYAYNI